MFEVRFAMQKILKLHEAIAIVLINEKDRTASLKVKLIRKSKHL